MASVVTGPARAITAGLFAPLTLRDILGRLVPVRAAAAQERVLPPRAPSIEPGTKHHKYALAICAGFDHDTACQQAEVKPRTPEDWRADLRATAAEYFGRTVTYEYAALYCVFPEFRAAVDAEQNHQGAAAASAAAPSMGVGPNRPRPSE